MFKKHAKPAYAALMKFYPLTLDDLDGELWKPIADYDAYHVSNFGRVKRFFNGKTKIKKPLLIGEYLYVYLSQNAKVKKFLIHRLVAQAFVPNPAGKSQIKHCDEHTMNNYFENLAWATPKEIMQHAIARGSFPQGADYPNAKFTNDQIEYIRANPDGLTQKQLGAKFGVAPSSILKIQRGITYKNAGGNIRKAKWTPIPEEIRAAIRAQYVKQSREFGSYALAKKYGVDPSIIWRIVNGR